MNAMGFRRAGAVDWYAVRMKSQHIPGRRTCIMGAEYETYRNRSGQLCKRRIARTGDRVHVPDLILRRAGFLTFLPLRKDWRKVNPRAPHRELVAYPLLIDWLFVGWPAGCNRFAELMALDVVVGVMGYGGRPARLPEPDVMRLMRTWGAGVLSAEQRQYMRKGAEFQPGDIVRVAEGPMIDAEVQVIDITGPSARALVRLFGSLFEVEFATSTLEGRGVGADKGG